MNYWIELYWPNKKRRTRTRQYDMWINAHKKPRHKRIHAGDIVFYYETQWKGRDRSVRGAMRLFAAGVITDEFSPVTKEYRDLGQGKNWTEWRTTDLFAWVPPEAGIPRVTLNRTIGKKAKFILRSGPFRIKVAEHGEKLVRMLRKLDRKSRKPKRVTPTPQKPPSDFRDVGLKSELTIRRKLVAREGTIRRRHNNLTNDFKRFCRKTLGVTPKEARFDALLEYGNGRKLLIEAKSEHAGGAGRDQIRHAIGQLFDYGHTYWPNSSAILNLAVLLPARPSKDILSLLWNVLSIHVIWRQGRTFVGLPPTMELLTTIAAKHPL